MKLLQTDSLTTTLQEADLSAASLYEPPPIPFKFETIGWPILAGVLLLALLITAIVLIRKHIKNRYRREALHELESINDKAVSPIFVILKRVAIRVFGREKAGPLTGQEWLQFLEKTGKNVQLLPFEKELNGAIYKDESVGDDVKKKLLFNAKKWIKTHEYSGKL